MADNALPYIVSSRRHKADALQNKVDVVVGLFVYERKQIKVTKLQFRRSHFMRRFSFRPVPSASPVWPLFFQIGQSLEQKLFALVVGGEAVNACQQNSHIGSNVIIARHTRIPAPRSILALQILQLAKRRDAVGGVPFLVEQAFQVLRTLLVFHLPL